MLRCGGLENHHGLALAVNDLGHKAYTQVSAGEQIQMMQPYSGVTILHLTIIGGGFVVMALGAPVLALMLLLRVGVDLAAHAGSREGAGFGL